MLQRNGFFAIVFFFLGQDLIIYYVGEATLYRLRWTNKMDVFSDTSTVFFGPSHPERLNPQPANGVTGEEEGSSFRLEVSSLRFFFVFVQCVFCSMFLGAAKPCKCFRYYNQCRLI